LFATHYHELTHLKDHFSGIATYHVECKKTNDGVLFLYKVLKGEAAGSFGLDVAKVANLPKSVISRAAVILKTLEKTEQKKEQLLFAGQLKIGESGDAVDSLQQKVSLLEELLAEKEEIIKEIQSVNTDDLSPKKAFDLIWAVKTKQRDL